MKLRFTIAWVIVMLVAGSSSAEQKGPWSFQNIVVLTFPSADVQISLAPDGRGVSLGFSSFDKSTEEAIKGVLRRSPLRYRVFRFPDATVGVEIFNQFSDIDYAVRRQKKVTQIIIGQVRPETIVMRVLGSTSGVLPLSKEIRQKIKKGELYEARRGISKQKPRSRREKYLIRTRKAVIDSAYQGPFEPKCEYLPKDVDSPEVAEGVYLAAWCLRENGDPATALKYLSVLENGSILPAQLDRVLALKAKIAAGFILAAHRDDSSVYAAAYALRYRKTVQDRLSTQRFLEIVALHLNRMGLGNLFTEIVGKGVADIAETRQFQLAPALTSTYLSEGQYVRALDAASYFLSKKLPRRYRARLARIRGYANFQLGDWPAAKADLKMTKEAGLGWGLEDQLSLVESFLRSRDPIEEIDEDFAEYLKDVNFKEVSKTNKYWIERMKAQIDLRSTRPANPKSLETVPSYILYQAAKEASEKGKTDLYIEWLKAAAKGKGGWRRVAEAEVQGYGLRQRFERIKRTLEAVQ